MLSRYPAKESLASFLSLTVTATPLSAAYMPPSTQSNGEDSQNLSGLVDKWSAAHPNGAINTGSSPIRSPVPPPHLSTSGGATSAPMHEQTEGSTLESLKIPPLLSLFSVTASSPSQGQARPPLQTSVAETNPAASSLAEAGVTLHSIPPAPIPLKKLESWIQFGEVQSAWLERRKAAKMNWLQRLGATIQHNFKNDPAVELSRQAIMLIQTTPEGREVLGQLQDEYSRTGRKLIIAAADFRGSAIIRNNGVETINGMRGQANPNEGMYLFNRKFLGFRDRDTALEYLCGNMSHEMRHLVSRGQVDRLSGRAGAAFSHAFIDEKRARLTGYLVAARLNKGRPTDYSDEARSWAHNPEAFWEELKSWSIYAHNLDMDEMRDPIRAFTKRIIMLRKAIQENDANISVNLPRIGSQIEILEQKEGLKNRLKGVRTIYENLRANEPGERAANKQMLYLITELRRTLSSAEGEKLLRSYQSVPEDRAFLLLQQDLKRDEQALRALIQTKRIPRFTPKRGQLSWDEFKERVRISQREHPEFWVEHRARFPVLK